MENKHHSTFIHACKNNNISNCDFSSIITNDYLQQAVENEHNEFTNGNTCTNVNNYLYLQNHPKRLRTPLYQEEKGSGKYKEISWEKAFSLITKKLGMVYEKNATFLPVAWLKGNANNGIHHYITDEFFASLGRTTKVVPANYYETASNMQLYPEDFESYHNIEAANLVIIWGEDTAKNNCHIYSMLKKVKQNNGTIIVIDPIQTETALFANYHLSIEPNSDHFLLSLIMKNLLQKDKQHFSITSRQKPFIDDLNSLDNEDLLNKCNITFEQLSYLVDTISNSASTVHLVGSGLEKHIGFDQFYNTLRILKQFQSIHESKRYLIFKRKKRPLLFNNQRVFQDLNPKNRLIVFNELFEQKKPTIEMLWISGANPINKYGNSDYVKKTLESIPFVVTVDPFLTPTAEYSNLILPTTTIFEEMDLVINNWEYGLQLSEKAIEPYENSLSEFNILNQLAVRLKYCMPSIFQFPNYESELDYLNKQWNLDVENSFFVKGIGELILKGYYQKPNIDYIKDTFETTVPVTSTVLPKHFIYKEVTKQYPYWLFTSKKILPIQTNSFSDDLELLIHENTAIELNILNGEEVIVYNEAGEVTIPVRTTAQVKNNVLMLHHSDYFMFNMHPISKLINNETFSLKSIYSRDIFHTVNDTFVNIKKLSH